MIFFDDFVFGIGQSSILFGSFVHIGRFVDSGDDCFSYYFDDDILWEVSTVVGLIIRHEIQLYLSDLTVVDDECGICDDSHRTCSRIGTCDYIRTTIPKISDRVVDIPSSSSSTTIVDDR